MNEMLPVPEHVYKSRTSIAPALLWGGGTVATTTQPIQTPDNTANPVGVAGLFMGLTGICGIIAQMYSRWLDSKSEKRLIADQNSKIQDQSNQLKNFQEKLESLEKKHEEETTALEGKREEERKKRHDLANTMQAVVTNLQADLFEAKIEVATLSTKLGLTDRVHANAINNNSENVRAIADRIDLPLPAEIPHVDPLTLPLIPSQSGDDFPVFPIPKPEPHQ